MEKVEESERTTQHPHMRTEYSRSSTGFGIEFGKPVKFPNLKKSNLNTSREEAEEKQKKFISLEKDKENKNKSRGIPRFTSQESALLLEEEKTEIFPKIIKIAKQTSSQRLERIKSEQNIVKENIETVGSYKMGGVIGKGTYANVRMVKGWKGGTYAMKIYDKSKINSSLLSNIRMEIQLMEQMDNENIIKYHETIDTPDSINIVMELVENYSLLDYLRNQPNKILTEAVARPIMMQLFRTIGYLHAKNIVHRDLKLENILISRSGVVKLIDFGFSQWGDEIHYDFCGTPHYMSPEIISKGGYVGQCADIWALGVIAYKLMVGVFPFRGLNDKILYRKIMRGDYVRSNDLSYEASLMIDKMLAMDPTQRPTAVELGVHEWVCV